MQRLIVMVAMVLAARAWAADPSELSKDCEANDGAACAQLAKAYLKGDGVRRDAKRAAKLAEKGCLLQDLDGCALQAELVRHDAKKALPLFRKACQLGHAASCTTAGTMLFHAKGAAKDPATSRELLRRACRLGDEPGCRALKGFFGEERPQASQ